MIFVNNSELPTISLVNDTAIVPCEIALLTAEIKSTITTETLEQIKHQRETLQKMRSQFLMAPSRPNAHQARERQQWIDKFRRLLVRYEQKSGYFRGFHLIAYTRINLRHLVAKVKLSSKLLDMAVQHRLAHGRRRRGPEPGETLGVRCVLTVSVASTTINRATLWRPLPTESGSKSGWSI